MIEKALVKATGLTIEDFVKKAIAGGWKPEEEKCRHVLMHDENGCPFGFHYPPTEKMLLDPTSWIAVGKVEGWEEDRGRTWVDARIERITAEPKEIKSWLYHQHRFIDALAEQYLTTNL